MSVTNWKPFPIAGGCYQDDTLPWSSQDTVNWIPVSAEVQGTRVPVMLRGAPGMKAAALAGQTFSNANIDASFKAGVVIRGAYNADGVFVVVQGNSLYRYTEDFSEPTFIGSVPGVGRVAITHNQITDGSQIVIATGTAGYVYNTVDGTFVQITDDGFPGAKSVDYIDSYIVAVEPQGRFWFASALADATSYNTLDQYEAESAPDKIIGLIVSHSEVIVFGERTMEFYYDSGAATGTFQRRDGTQTEIGAATQFAIVKQDNTVYWLGNDGSIYRLDGYTPTRISTQPMEQAISRCNLANAFAMVYSDRGHKIVYFTFPDGHTWGYDVATQMWHRRQSYGMKRWRVNTLTQWKNLWYAGDFTDGSLCTLDWKAYTENGRPLVAERVAPVIHADQNRFELRGVELAIDSSVGVISTPGIWLTGDMPGGLVSDTTSGTYVGHGGTAPYTITLESGALPDGVTLSGLNDGSWSGAFTTAGTFSWRMKGVDANGLIAYLDDTAVVATSTLVTAAVAHWKLNDSGSTAVDSSGNGFDLTYTGTVTKRSETITPNGDDAALFGGGCAYGTWAPLGTLPVTGNGFSVCAWIRHPALQPYTATVSCRIAGCWEVRDFSDDGNFGLLLARAGAGGQSGPDDKPWFFIGKHNYAGLSGGTIPVDTPVLLTATLDATHTTMKLYAGTSLIASGPLSGTLQFAPQDVIRLGGSEAYPSSYDFRGVISDVILFNKELTANDIVNLNTQGAHVTYQAFP